MLGQNIGRVGLPDMSAGGRPSLSLDFVGIPVLNEKITFTRASTATYFDSSGTLQSAAIDVPRFDFNPSTLAPRGLLIEEARTNSIRNNSMVGAVAGTPGTLPTNWTGGATVDGLNREIVGTGTQNGITYIDVRYSGTSGVSGSQVLITFDSVTQVVAANGQTWTSSVFLSVVGGNTNNISTLTIRHRYYDSGGAALTALDTNVLTGISGVLQRFNASAFTAANASTAYTMFLINADFVNSSAVDFTLRIGLPQLEQGAFATSVIPTTTTALTRSADVASVNTLSPWFNASQGTTYFEGVTFDSLSAAFPRAYQFNDGTNNNVIQITRNNGNGNARMSVVSGGVSQAAADATAWTLNATTKAALAYAANDFAIVANGGAATTDTSGTVPTVTNLLLGSQSGAAGFLNGYLRRISYYPRRLSNAELQSITS